MGLEKVNVTASIPAEMSVCGAVLLSHLHDTESDRHRAILRVAPIGGDDSWILLRDHSYPETTSHEGWGCNIMNIARKMINGVIIIRPRGPYLDASRSKVFRRDVIEWLPSTSRVILDLSEIQFIDSAGCGLVLAAARQANPGGRGPGDLKICGLTNRVRLVFEIVRIHKILEIYNTQEEAFRAFDVESIALATI